MNGTVLRRVHSVPSGALEAAGFVIVLLLALGVRIWGMGDLPAGFHGDEAVIGLEAQRVLRDGYIGPYSPYAAGQPTGPIYLFALAAAVVEDRVIAVRIVPALLGTLTVLALYVVARRSFGVPVALVAAAVLATMSWHLHFSRIAFPLITWPLWAILIAGTLVEGMRTGDWRWWAAAGALTGSGIYIYNAHPLLAFITALFVGGYLVVNRSRPMLEDLATVVLMALVALLVLVPMIRYATADDSFYWYHFERERLTDTDEWQSLDSGTEQVRFLAAGYRGIWDWLCCAPELDLVDGSGLTIITPPVMLLLAAFGVIVALGFYRSPLVFFGLLVILLLPLAPVLSTGGQIRRTFAMTPFLALFVALATVGSVQIARRSAPRLLLPSAIAALVILGVVVTQNLTLYFREFAAPEVQEEILGKPLADAAKFLNGLDDDVYVYFYSDIWSINYATMIYLAPDINGEDRSREFGEYGFTMSEHSGQPMFVFLGDYLGDLETVQARYPGHEITPVDHDGRPTFRVFLPELP